MLSTVLIGVILILNSILNKIKVKKPRVKRTSGLVIYLGPLSSSKDIPCNVCGNGISFTGL